MQWFKRHTRGRPLHPDVLTPAEWRVLELARAGQPNAEIAERLGITISTVKTHMTRILDKLDLPDRRALADWKGEPSAEGTRRSGLAVPAGWLTLKAAGALGLAALGVIMALGFATLMDSGRLTQGGSPDANLEAITPTTTPLAEVPPGGSVPPFAPLGRTGDVALDDLIDRLVNDDAAAIVQRHSGVAAREWRTDVGEEGTYPTVDWASRLADSERSLYGVLRGEDSGVPARDFDIVLAANEPGAQPIAWVFAVDDGQLVDVVVAASELTFYAEAVERQHGRYLVLPPPNDLPEPPPGHGLDVRTGRAEVDALLALIEARDGSMLSSVVTYESRPCGAEDQASCPPGTDPDAPEVLPVLRCGGDREWISQSSAELRFDRILAVASSVHGVLEVPSGAQPDANHLVVVITQVAPYRWESAGIYERSGRIVGLHTQCYSYPPGMYPPSAFIVPPPDDAAAPDVVRSSGSSMIDGTVEALRDGDFAAFDALADWEQVGCVAVQDGIDAPPLCRADEPPGTLLDVLPVAGCEGGPQRREEIVDIVSRIASDGWSLYSVADIGSPTGRATFPPGAIEALLVDPPAREPGDAPSVLGLSYTDQGLASLRFPCGGVTPEALASPGRSPTFLLAPPP